MDSQIYISSRDEQGWVENSAGCWVWQLSTRSGYGQLSLRLRDYPGFLKRVQAHRYFYEKYRGPIPYGMQIDHLCLNKLCVNPDHLEVVTLVENIQRAHTHCKRGHVFTDDNIYIPPGTKRRNCKKCRYEASLRRSEKRREEKRRHVGGV